MICNTKLMVQSTLFVTENTLFVNQITQNTLLTAFMVTVTDGWQIHNLDNMILGQLKIGERQATFGGVLTITCASPHPPRMPTKTTSLNFSYFQGECPPSPSLLSDSVSPINVYLQWDCFWNVIKPTAFHFVRKYAVWSSNQMVHQSSSCLERTKFPSFSFEMGPLHWPMRRKSTTPKFCRCFSLPLPSECRGKKGDQPLL